MNRAIRPNNPKTPIKQPTIMGSVEDDLLAEAVGAGRFVLVGCDVELFDTKDELSCIQVPDVKLNWTILLIVALVPWMYITSFNAAYANVADFGP